MYPRNVQRFPPHGKLSSYTFFSQLTYVAQIQLQFTLSRHGKSITCLAISPDGRTLLSGGALFAIVRYTSLTLLLGQDGCAFLWNLETGKEIRRITCLFNGPISALSWTCDEKRDHSGFALGCADGTIHAYRNSDANASICGSLPYSASTDIVEYSPPTLSYP